MRFAPIRLMTAGDMSGSLSSNGVNLNQMVKFTIQAVFTGAPVGTLKLQISTDDVPQAPAGQNPSANVVNWTDYTGSSLAVSAAGNVAWLVEGSGYQWVRVVYTVTGGTGSMNIEFNGQAV